MPWSTWKRLVQKNDGFFFFLPTVNAYQYLTSWKVCDWSGHIFGAGVSLRSLTKKDGYVTLFHCSWRSAWYQICGIRVAIACGIRGWRNLGFYAWTSSCLVNIIMKPTSSSTQGQPTPRKIRLKVAFGPLFPTANNFSWVGICFI